MGIEGRSDQQIASSYSCSALAGAESSGAFLDSRGWLAKAAD